MGFEREKRLGLVGLDPEQRAARLEYLRKETEQREKGRAAVAQSAIPPESNADFPSRAIASAAAIYSLVALALAVCVFCWAFRAMEHWLGRDWAVLLGMPAVLLPLLLGPMSDRAEWRLREWYCNRHGGHVLRPLAGSDILFTCTRCEHTVAKKE